MVLDYITWDIEPEIFKLFGTLSIRYYGLLFVTGLILSLVVLNRVFKREGIAPDKLEKLAVYSMIGIIVGARLGHCIFYEPETYLTSFNGFIEMLLPIQKIPGEGYKFTGYQGLASHGGAIGTLIALWLYTKKTKEPLLRTLDYIAIVAPLTGCFIRLANLMNSEIVGMPATVPWAFIFVQNDNIPRHPGQLYEAISYILIFALLINLYRSKSIKFQRGFLFGLSLILIFMARFFIEFIKEHQGTFEDGMELNMGQWLSLPFILVGVGFLIYSFKYSKEPGKIIKE